MTCVGFLPDVNLPLHPLLTKRINFTGFYDLVAQSVEHLTFNQGVMGSSPIEITTLKANYLYVRMLAFFVFGLGIDLGMVQIMPTQTLPNRGN